MGLLLDIGKKWFLEFPGNLTLLRDSFWDKQWWNQTQIVCTPCLWQLLGLWHGNGNGNERQGKVPSFNPPCQCRSALRASAKFQRLHRLRVVFTLKFVSVLGWGACSLRACSDRLFEGLSLQAFFIVFGSLLNLQFGMFVSWFCCGIMMQSSMQDTNSSWFDNFVVVHCFVILFACHRSFWSFLLAFFHNLLFALLR